MADYVFPDDYTRIEGSDKSILFAASLLHRDKYMEYAIQIATALQKMKLSLEDYKRIIAMYMDLIKAIPGQVNDVTPILKAGVSEKKARDMLIEIIILKHLYEQNSLTERKDSVDPYIDLARRWGKDQVNPYIDLSNLFRADIEDLNLGELKKRTLDEGSKCKQVQFSKERYESVLERIDESGNLDELKDALAAVMSLNNMYGTLNGFQDEKPTVSVSEGGGRGRKYKRRNRTSIRKYTKRRRVKRKNTKGKNTKRRRVKRKNTRRRNY